MEIAAGLSGAASNQDLQGPHPPEEQRWHFRWQTAEEATIYKDWPNEKLAKGFGKLQAVYNPTFWLLCGLGCSHFLYTLIILWSLRKTNQWLSLIWSPSRLRGRGRKHLMCALFTAVVTSWLQSASASKTASSTSLQTCGFLSTSSPVPLHVTRHTPVSLQDMPCLCHDTLAAVRPSIFVYFCGIFL